MSGTIYNPTNLPPTGTYLANQQFSITNLLSGTYLLEIYDPVTRVTHNVTLSASRQQYKCPKLIVNHITSEPIQSDIQISGARLVPNTDPDVAGLNPNGTYSETSLDQWTNNGPHGLVVEYNTNQSKWQLRTPLANTIIEETNVVPKTTKPWQTTWSDLDSNGTNMTVTLLVSGTDNTGGFSLTFASNEDIPDQGVTMVLEYGEQTITKNTTRGTSVTFSNLDSLIVTNNNLTVTDIASNKTWTLKVRIGYGPGISYIQHNDNVLYQSGDTIFFKTEQIPSSRLVYKNGIYKPQEIIALN